ncbi:hypothetical protein EV1_011072 [Malus domestica]
MFKMDVDDGTANLVLLPDDLLLAYRITVQSNGVVLVGNGEFYDKIALDPEGSPTLVAVYGEDKVYVL